MTTHSSILAWEISWTKEPGGLQSMVKVKAAQSCLTLCDPVDYTVHGILQARILELGSHSLLQGIFPTQGLNTAGRFFLPAEPKGKPKNTQVGSLPLLQRIFQTQKLIQGLLHFRQSLYQLGYQGSPYRNTELQEKSKMTEHTLSHVLGQVDP